jgi:hypothetical protein
MGKVPEPGPATPSLLWGLVEASPPLLGVSPRAEPAAEPVEGDLCMITRAQRHEGGKTPLYGEIFGGLVKYLEG